MTNNSIDIVKLLLDYGAKISDRSVFGSTGLNKACESGNLELLKFLFEKGGHLNIFADDDSLDGCYKSLEMAKWMIENYPEVAKNEYFVSKGLYFACGSGGVDFVEFWIDMGADVNEVYADGYTPIMVAFIEGKCDVIEYLFGLGVSITVKDDFGNSLLHHACKSVHGFNAVMLKEIILHAYALSSYIDLKTYKNLTPLHYACSRNKLDFIKALLALGADITSKDDSGWTPLHHACSESLDIQVIDYLCQKGTDVSALDNSGSSALHLAAKAIQYPPCQSDDDAFKYLVRKSGNVNIKNNEGFAPIHHICQPNRRLSDTDLGLVQFLIDEGADVNIQNSAGLTPLFFACQNNGHRNCDLLPKLLIDLGASVQIQSYDGYTPFHYSCIYGCIEIVNVLLEHGGIIDLNPTDGSSLLHQVCDYFDPRQKTEREEIITFLLKHGADPNLKDCSGMTPVHYLSKRDDREALKLLFKRGAVLNVVDNSGSTPMHYSCLSGSIRTAIFLFEHGAFDINHKNNNGSTLIHFAAQRENSLFTGYLRGIGGVDLNVKDNSGSTPMHYATESAASAKMVASLTVHGADLDSKNDSGSTPLFLACKNVGVDKIRFLLCKGADVNARNNTGATPLFSACESPSSQIIIRILVSHGADLNIKDDSGSTPVHHACLKGKLNSLRCLHALGADLNIKDNFGLTPLQITQKYRHSHLSEFLIEHGDTIVM